MTQHMMTRAEKPGQKRRQKEEQEKARKRGKENSDQETAVCRYADLWLFGAAGLQSTDKSIDLTVEDLVHDWMVFAAQWDHPGERYEEHMLKEVDKLFAKLLARHATVGGLLNQFIQVRRATGPPAFPASLFAIEQVFVTTEAKSEMEQELRQVAPELCWEHIALERLIAQFIKVRLRLLKDIGIRIRPQTDATKSRPKERPVLSLDE